jgi:hypothetical protein
MNMSISEYGESVELNSENVGVVELMVLVVCDKCIESKNKYLIGLELESHRLKVDNPALSMYDLFSVVTENGSVVEYSVLKGIYNIINHCFIVN